MIEITLKKIRGPVCPSCGRDNKDNGEFCTADTCPGVMFYDAAPELLEACKALPLDKADWDNPDAADFKDNARSFLIAMTLARNAIAKIEEN